MGELERVPKPAVESASAPPVNPGAPGFLAKVRDAITVKRVYGKAIERHGVTVIPAAFVSGGGGGGGGSGVESDGKTGTGTGGGFGVKARPAGAFVISDGNVHWEPAVDPERRLAIAAGVGVVALLVARSVLPRHWRRGRHRKRR